MLGLCWVYAGFMVILCWVRWIEKCHRCFLSKRKSFRAIQAMTPGMSMVRMLFQYPICEPWCWYIYPQNWVIFRANVGVHIPAPWRIWVSNLAKLGNLKPQRRLSNAANFWGLEMGTWNGVNALLPFYHSAIPFLPDMQRWPNPKESRQQFAHGEGSRSSKAAVPPGVFDSAASWMLRMVFFQELTMIHVPNFYSTASHTQMLHVWNIYLHLPQK